MVILNFTLLSICSVFNNDLKVSEVLVKCNSQCERQFVIVVTRMNLEGKECEQEKNLGSVKSVD